MGAWRSQLVSMTQGIELDVYRTTYPLAPWWGRSIRGTTSMNIFCCLKFILTYAKIALSVSAK